MVQSRGQPILVIRQSEEVFKAFSAICPHLGCIVKWDSASKQILCPCHAAAFSAEGQVVAGPPPRPLKEYQVSVVSDQVLVKLA